MSDKAPLRLAALHSNDADEASALLQAASGPLPGPLPALVEDAVLALQEEIEAAIIKGEPDISLSLEAAELLSIALKTRERPASRPLLTGAERANRYATVELAKALSRQYRAEGMRAGQADERAAKEAARVGGALAWTTIYDRMRRGGKKPKA
ncbi:hypothetical protein [Sphingosinicella sp. YJ22]|uniref:hypothetical protein n=1 Tax=Sphingosinicella sp. YJ22 TaxID=1104780 RepID=UPI001408B2E5|nr:hypothetical protein [Sphingosinicella sp. YJ22]